MNRKLVWLVTVLLLSFDYLAEAQQPAKIFRVGLLMSVSTTETAPLIDAFRQGLRDLSYIEGKNIALEIRGGDAKTDRLPALAAELVRLKVDAILAGGSFAVRAAKEATSTIPIVMRTGSDPVEAGFISSLARPGGNITGVTSITTELIGKRLELLGELIPGLKRVAVLTAATHLDRWIVTDQYKEMDGVARALGVKLQIFHAQESTTIDNAFLAMSKERCEALNVIPSPRFSQYRGRIVEQAAKNRVPTIYSENLSVETGGLMSYGANNAHEYRRAARYLDKILKGAKPADLPVEQASKYELVINLKTAKQIGLTIPPNMLARADRVIK
jgi:putative ABC transport system substrate-binding protein